MNLVTDRTRGAVYSVEDLNRVENAVAELLKLAKQIGVNLDLDVKTDWALPGMFSADAWPTWSQLMRYLDNVGFLCEALEVAANLPPSMHCLSYRGANQIEEALLAVEKRILKILQTYRYSGEFFAGEEIAL